MKKLVIAILVLLPGVQTYAGEGMWLPLLLGQLNEKEMQSMGMRITADDIYSINHSSLKDAIVLFGGGCTGEVVSDQGLLLTNHHCGYGNILNHSTLEHDYLTHGFWAQNFSEELVNPSLSVTFLVRMEDVTQQLLSEVNSGMNESQRQQIITSKGKTVINEATKGTHYRGVIKPFYNGNQYYLFITETFNDVRLVGAPPSNIGKFGGDTDNWVWPRHTGDFSIFRIYADKNNNPAPYSKDNVPYKPKKHLPISLKGAKEGDFTFVFGYPGTTQEYLPATSVEMIAMEKNPIAIALRQQRLDIINKAIESDPLIRIQYSAKAAGIANGWKKMIGESTGIKHSNGVGKKQGFEDGFTQWVNSDASHKSRYGNLLTTYNQLTNAFIPVNKAYTYLSEGPSSIELLRFAGGFENLVKLSSDKTLSGKEVSNEIEKLNTGAVSFYKNYNLELDREIFTSLMKSYCENCNREFIPAFINEVKSRYKNDYSLWAKDLYNKSLFSDSVKMKRLLASFNSKKARLVTSDPAYRLAIAVNEYMQHTLRPLINAYSAKTDSLQRIYMAAQMEMQPSRRFYPDANLTLRVAYGRISGYSASDAIEYKPFTTLDGIMEKENPNIYDYVVEDKLKELYSNKAYGPYADKDGKMHVAFIASNHTTGGNSGSPVMDGDGNLIGINFDRCWEGTMSDLAYDPEVCRNISLDIRYCLFIIDKFAGARRLVKEMTLVQ